MTVLLVAWYSSLALTVGYIVAKWILRRRRGPLFPPIDQQQVLYKELFGSGRSMQNVLTQVGGAKNCLKLVVTTDELWVTPVLPFAFLAEPLDLEHRIRKKDIVTLHEENGWLLGKRLTIEYRHEDGQVSRIEIKPSRYAQFKQALMTGTLAAIQ